MPSLRKKYEYLISVSPTLCKYVKTSFLYSSQHNMIILNYSHFNRWGNWDLEKFGWGKTKMKTWEAQFPDSSLSQSTKFPWEWAYYGFPLKCWNVSHQLSWARQAVDNQDAESIFWFYKLQKKKKKTGEVKWHKIFYFLFWLFQKPNQT